MANSADPDQLASSEANWSGSTLFEKGRIYPGSAGQGLNLEVKIWSLISAWKSNNRSGAISPLYTIFSIHLTSGMKSHVISEMYLVDLFFPQLCKFNMSRYGYLEVLAESPLDFEITRVHCTTWWIRISWHHPMLIEVSGLHNSDKSGYPQNISLISQQKHILWVLIRSTSMRHC